MSTFAADREVPHSAQRMLDLVADVERYPDFLPHCEALVVKERAEDGATTVMVATMTISYSMLHESFTSRVVVDPERSVVTASYLDGPFDHLETVWTFEDLDDTRSVIRFSIDYAFKSGLLGAVMGAAFPRLFESFSEAFARRADEIYGSAGV